MRSPQQDSIKARFILHWTSVLLGGGEAASSSNCTQCKMGEGRRNPAKLCKPAARGRFFKPSIASAGLLFAFGAGGVVICYNRQMMSCSVQMVCYTGCRDGDVVRRCIDLKARMDLRSSHLNPAEERPERISPSYPYTEPNHLAKASSRTASSLELETAWHGEATPLSHCMFVNLWWRLELQIRL